MAKRDALEEANTEVQELQDAIRAAESSKGALQAKADQLAKTRRGCVCKKGLEEGSGAGRCTNCSCSRAGLQCNDSRAEEQRSSGQQQQQQR